MKKLIFLLVLFSTSSALMSQTNVNMGGAQTSITRCDFYIYDNGGPTGNYGANRLDSLTIYPASGSGVISIFVEEVSIDPSDTLFFYNSATTTGEPVPFIFGSLGTNWINSSNLNTDNLIVTATMQNTSGAITLLFKSDASNQSSGFKLKVSCQKPCQRLLLEIDTLLTYPRPHWETVNDTAIDPCTGQSTGISTYRYIDLCPKDTLHLVGKVTFPDQDYSYHQSIDSTWFSWRFSGDSVAGYGISEFDHTFSEILGYNLALTAKDQKGCIANTISTARVRISKNIITGSLPLQSICAGDTLKVEMGNRLSSTMQVQPILFETEASLSVVQTISLPDGNGVHYVSPVTFTQFQPNAVVESANDILAVCVNMEHSFIGDLTIRLQCYTPAGQLKEVNILTTYADGTRDPNQSNSLGIPVYGNNNAVPGIGWDYCWTTTTCSSYTDTWTDKVFNHCGNDLSGSADSSWKNAKREYYTPKEPFSGLIGCKMNGLWQIYISDDWLNDDGYIFSWDLALSKRLLETNWSYMVKPDSIAIEGSWIEPVSANRAIVVPPKDASGTFAYKIGVFDNLGCRYDTAVNLSVYPIPQPEIGEDFSICTGEMRQLTASNMPGDATYYWNNGMTTPSINIISGGKYTVDVAVAHLDTNYNFEFECKGRDSVQVTVNPSPFVEFAVEGDNQCAPAELKLKNNTTFALHPGQPLGDVDVTYQWYVWDENWNLYLSSTLFEPDFILENPGAYHVILYAYTVDGCKDSLIKYSFIKIYEQPVVEFLATPESQMLSDGGIVHFYNFTDTLLLSNPNTSWYWDFGDGNMDSSAFSLEHTYETWGDYDVIFYVRTEDGCSDQIAHRVIIEDNITFPNNIITPNGDGLNDVFVIGGLNTRINPEDPGKFRENQLIIYDRWGKKVYEAKNYDTYLNQDGETVVGKKAFGGEKCSDGTYSFTFYYKGKVKTFHLNGTIMIVREAK